MDNNRSITTEIIQDLTHAMKDHGQRLMKFKFSKINMNDDDVITNICEYIQNNVGINYIEMSWCQLKADNLLRLATMMASNPYSIRSVNLSYNNLNFNSKKTKRKLHKDGPLDKEDPKDT